MTTETDATHAADDQARSARQTRMRRLALAIAAALTLGYTLSALRGVYLALVESSLAPEQPGVFPMLAASSAAISIALAREAFSSQPHRVLRLIGRAFGYGWILGVCTTIALTVVRLVPEANAFDIGDVALVVFNYAIVGLFLALSGLVALLVTRRRPSA